MAYSEGVIENRKQPNIVYYVEIGDKEMKDPKKSKSIFAKATAKQFFIAALVSFALDVIVSLATQDFRPSTQSEAIIPGLIMGVLGWVAIICLIAGIVKWLSSRKK